MLLSTEKKGREVLRREDIGLGHGMQEEGTLVIMTVLCMNLKLKIDKPVAVA
jgi:hypothetical protein